MCFAVHFIASSLSDIHFNVCHPHTESLTRGHALCAHLIPSSACCCSCVFISACLSLMHSLSPFLSLRFDSDRRRMSVIIDSTKQHTHHHHAEQEQVHMSDDNSNTLSADSASSLPSSSRFLICKGAADEIISVCSSVHPSALNNTRAHQTSSHSDDINADLSQPIIELDQSLRAACHRAADSLSGRGFRLVAVAYKELANGDEESGREFSGKVQPPRE